MVRRKRQVLGWQFEPPDKRTRDDWIARHQLDILREERASHRAELAIRARQSYRPTAFWSRSTMQVEAALATSRFFSSVISHST
jgi:hypothetical protein